MTLGFMFPDQSFDLEPLKPLSWHAAIHDFFLPEAVVLLIQEDFPQLPRESAIETMLDSTRYGNIRFSKEDSLAIRNVTKKITDTMARNNALYDEYEVSGSLLSFGMWAKERTKAGTFVSPSVKVEASSPQVTISALTADNVIDLTHDESI